MTSTTTEAARTRGPMESSRTHQLTQLEIGEYVSDVIFLPAPVEAGQIVEARTKFNQLWATAIARARVHLGSKSQFSAQSFTAVNNDAHVAVSYVIQRIS